MIVYRIYNENGGYTEYTEIPQDQDYEVIEKEIVEEVIVPEKIGAIPFLVQLELMGINEDAIVSKIDFLHQNGILSDQQKIEALVSVKRATIFERNHPFIALIANAFEISKEEVDQIFINGQ